MKKLFTGILAIAMLILLKGNLSAQTVTTKTTVTPSQVLEYAKAAKELLGGRTYEVITIQKKVDKSSPFFKTIPYFTKGNELINKVIKEGSSMTPANALKYEKEMQEIGSSIDRLINVTQLDHPIPECFKGCDTNYPGLGGGSGWKRFCCKMSCLIVETAD